jgi:(1->4)-alpha-D-glucan 1-alpha-D-glucosylmutase
MFKAIREAKEHSSWANPNTQYENAVKEFIRAILDRKPKNRFLHNFEEFQSRVSRIGLLNSLSQTLLKLTCPGVPDVYQGNELWDFSLVDPDNRRAVDYSRRRELLLELQNLEKQPGCEPACRARSFLNSLEDGRAKLFLIFKTLNFRREHAAFFQNARYLPLTPQGPAANHICAFARQLERQIAIVAVPRLTATLLGDKRQSVMGAEIWEQTTLEIPADMHCPEFHNVLTHENVRVEASDSGAFISAADLFNNFPVALLAGEMPG